MESKHGELEAAPADILAARAAMADSKGAKPADSKPDKPTPRTLKASNYNQYGWPAMYTPMFGIACQISRIGLLKLLIYQK